MSGFDKPLQESAQKAKMSFNDILKSAETSGRNVKKELRQVQSAMQSMLASGVSPADAAYQQLAKRAGELKDAIGDVNEEIKAQANDTRNMTLAFGAMEDGMSVFQAGQAAMSMFGVESEGAAAAIQKMMAAQQMLNAIQTLGNSITSKSTVLGKGYAAVKALLSRGAAAQTAAEGAAAASTTGLAAAEGGATLATTLLSAALNAIPFVAMATGAVLLITAIVKLANKAKTSQEALESLRAVTKSLTDANGKAAEEYMSSSLEIERYKKKVDEFRGSKEDEAKLVKELNSKYGEAMGNYSTLKDWKETLIQQSDSYCKMLAEEARAQALSAKMAELYAQQVTGEIKYDDYVRQVEVLKDAWNDALQGVSVYKTILRTSSSRQNSVTPTTSGGTTSSRGGSRGGSVSLTSTLHTMDDVEAKIRELGKAVASTDDLSKKLELSKQLEQVKSFKAEVEKLTSTMKSGSADMASVVGLGTTGSFKTDISGDLSEMVGTINEEAVEKFLNMQETIASFKESLTGDIGGIVSDWTTLGECFKDGIDFSDAAAGCVLLGESLQQLGGNGAIAKAGSVLAAVGQIILGFATASAQAASMGPWGWLAFVGAGLGTIATVISTVKGFNRGGIVEGAGAGDTVPAMLTPGEAVFTRNDQSQLFRMIRGGGFGGLQSGEIRLRVHGTDLVGAIRNNNAINSKI